MKVVILDAYTANPGDLSWGPVEAVGPCTIHDRTAAGELLARAAGAEALVTNKTLLDRDTIAALPALRVISVLATGYNVVDVAAARDRGIAVCNVPEYATPNTAQATWALILELTNRVGELSASVHAGRWSKSPDFCYWDGELVELAGRTLGIVGYGRIGRTVAAIGRAFGMRILAHRRTPGPDAECVDLETLLRESDVVSLHCPLTPETQGLIDARRLALMKPTALLVNAARGPLVVEADLAAALDAGRIAGAALDVLSIEPPPASNPLLTAKNCIITPHVAWATRDARRRLIEATAENLRAFAAGRPRNVVNP
jgi:glycerate dehydrogenase